QVTLFEDKITVRDTTGDAEALPRRYSLTHSDRTADLLLSVGTEYDREALDQPQTRQTRDELLAELTGGDQPRLTVRCGVESREVTGRTADLGTRRRIFEREMPLALAVIRYGDRFFFERHPDLDQAEIIVEFEPTDLRFQAKRRFGRVAD